MDADKAEESNTTMTNGLAAFRSADDLQGHRLGDTDHYQHGTAVSPGHDVKLHPGAGQQQH